MRIHWYGHAAFQIEAAKYRIILDPYRSPDCGGFAPIDDPADLVVVSHENDRYHSHLGQIRGPFEVIRGLELPEQGTTWRGIRIAAIPCFETPDKLPGDEVTIVQFEVEGLRVAHLGDLGHALEPTELEQLRGTEIVLAAAGGPPTIDFPLIAPLLEAIGPRVVIPMHYYVPGKINLRIQPLERFLEALPDWTILRMNQSFVDLTAETLPDRPTILCLEPAR